VDGRVAQPEGAERACRLVRLAPREIAVVVGELAGHQRGQRVVDAAERRRARLLPQLAFRLAVARVKARPACHAGSG